MSGYFTEKATAAWGTPLPDWIAALATACDQTSQARAATKIGRSGALVSGVLAKTYRGDMGAVEELVRGHLLSETVNCPALGVLPLHECRGWMAKARAFQNTNSLRVRMYRACHRCPRFTKEICHDA
ncbi:MAG: hypothetical protein KDJ98_08195 [Rhodobacteraceae bacterium]|nr:hypothetical protein [Paracoccaceae bacterium]